MNIENLFEELESYLCNIGYDPLTSAYLIHINLNGNLYTRSGGDQEKIKQLIKSQNSIKFLKFIESELERSPLRTSTKQLHQNTIYMLKSYKEDISLYELNANEIQKIEQYMQDKNLSTNTIGRHMKVVKKYINIARKKNLIENDPFLCIKQTPKVSSEKTYLSKQELQKFERYRDKKSDNNEVLNAFLFACFTGLGFSDIKNVSLDNLHTINKRSWLIIKLQQTSLTARIPIASLFNGKAEHIMQTQNKSPLFKLPNNQKTNRELKKIASSININKKITFNTARTTCISLLEEQGIPLNIIKIILGQKNIKNATLNKITDDEIQKIVQSKHF